MDRFLKCVPVFKFFQAISVCSHIRSFDDNHANIFKNEFNVFFFGTMGSFFILLFVFVKTCRALQAILYPHILVTRCGYRGVAGGHSPPPDRFREGRWLSTNTQRFKSYLSKSHSRLCMKGSLKLRLQSHYQKYVEQINIIFLREYEIKLLGWTTLFILWGGGQLDPPCSFSDFY